MKQRIISAIIAVIICIPIILYGGSIFYLSVALIGLIGFTELLKSRRENRNIPVLINAIGLVCFIILMMDGWGNNVFLMDTYSKIHMIIFVVLLPVVFYNSSKKYNIEDAFFLLGSIFFLGFAFNTLASVRINSLYHFIFLLLITIMSDTFAYFTGYFIGRHKMCPTISPNKTWEGFFGGLIFSTFVTNSPEYSGFSFLPSPELKPTITQCTAALSADSLSHLNVRWAKSICIPKRLYSGFHTSATCSPWVMELVETKAAFLHLIRPSGTFPSRGRFEVAIYSAALKYHPAT